MGYTPTDPEHLEYFKLDGDLRTELLSGAGAPAQPATHFVAYEWLDAGMPGAARPGDGTQSAQVAGDASGERHVLVLWLDQDMFWGAAPIQGISRLFGYFFATPAPKTPRSTTATTPAAPKQSVIILGPGDSTLLRHMVEESRSAAKRRHFLVHGAGQSPVLRLWCDGHRRGAPAVCGRQPASAEPPRVFCRQKPGGLSHDR
jgi:hypothetical protein